MQQKNPIGWVEIPVLDMDRAENFYSEFFGFEMTRQPEKDGYVTSWFPMDENYGAAGMLIKGDGYVPSYKEGPVVYFTAPEGSVEKAIAKAQDMGVQILVPKTDIGDHGFFAWIEDTERNRIAVHSMEE